jgi:hypothetical protein
LYQDKKVGQGLRDEIPFGRCPAKSSLMMRNKKKFFRRDLPALDQSS